ncbi:hypothetical protein PG994_008254 [Apiospora phragmitis]|uniref:Rhodopsin domain-containing protein n=1 Tax=Apiospora phragmitis TaxID=2905665 RepID=A0ABR1USJ2_9PEZI
MPGVADFCMLSCALTATFTGLILKCSTMGIGRHIWDVPAPWLTEALKFFTISTYVYLILSACIKLMFLFFYRRLFLQHPKMKYTVGAAIAFVSLFHLAIFFATVFACSPIARQWDVSIPGNCNNPEILPYLSGSVSSVTDIFVLLLPVPLVWTLHATTRKKFGVLAVFGVGVLSVSLFPWLHRPELTLSSTFSVCAASLVRLGMTPVLRSNFDATWNISTISLRATLEVNVGIVCGCSMLFPAFFKRHFPNFTVGSLLHVLRSRLSGVSRKDSSDSSDYVLHHRQQWHGQKGIHAGQVEESSYKRPASAPAGANVV